ncbi:MAG TPA: sigma-70 family RNA polymerase sigma factor [Natronosporangium sp.]
MTKLVGRHRPDGDAPADTELMAAVRAGDSGAFEVLYDRHVDAARRLARALVRDPADADDLVAEAFAKVLAALRLGRGPTVAFRAYLLTAVRHASYDRSRRDRRIEFTDDLARYESGGGPTAGDQVVTRLDRSYAARAFARLPERWQVVLWHTEVEGEKPAAIAPLLGLTPNAVAALAYRARERLRQMYLQEHLSGTSDPSCHWAAARFGAHLRRGLPRRERTKVDAHLAGCDDCRAVWAELAEVNRGLRGVLAPVVLGAAAAPYLASVPAAAWWTGAVAAVREAWALLVGRVQGWIQRHGSTNVAAGAGLAAAGLIGVLLFALVMMLKPPDPAEPEPPVAEAPPQPAPEPAPPPPPPPVPPPERPAPADPPTGRPAALPESTSSAPSTPAPPAGSPTPAPIEVAPDLSGTSLAAGEPGQLAITVHRPATPAAATSADASDKSIMEVSRDPPHDPRESSMIDAGEGADEAQLAVRWPAGIRLADPDAGDGWECDPAPAGPASVVCSRPVWPAGEASTARLPVTVDQSLGGFAPITVDVTGVGKPSQARFRVPVAPPGFTTGYAATGPLGLAMIGNTWLSCPYRPACLADDPLDNDLLPPLPYLPGTGEPTMPPGLPGTVVAASGARLALPAGAEVSWAALHWAATGPNGPPQVRLHGPAGGWHTIAADAVQPQPDRPLRQAYADVTGLVRDAGAGAWWVAADRGPLPTGRTASAGWSLTVLYELPGPERDVAVFTGPGSLGGDRPSLSVTAGEVDADWPDPEDAALEVGLVGWEGDRMLTGDRLRLDDQPLGDPENALASRAAGALECGRQPIDDCRWHTFGVDVAQYGGTGRAVRLTTEQDRLEIGVLVLSVDRSR